VQTDVKNAFNEATRHAAFDTVNDKASKPYDNRNVQPGENILTFPELRHAFPYFRSMHSDHSINWFFDHKDVSHTIYGTTGGQQGDPLEMLRFCVTTHPIWARIMNRSPTTQGAAFADDCFLMDTLPQVLRVAADSQKSFSADADLDLQPAKFNIHVKGVSHEHARELIEKFIDSDDYLTCLRPLLDDAFGCIQADSLRVAGVPIGSDAFVTNYVRSKALDLVQDVDKLDIMKDPLTKYHSFKYCQQIFALILLAETCPLRK
jgi:hypothetical protein